MRRILILCTSLMLLAGVAIGEDEPVEGDKLLGGMSILGNDEAPKSLAIVPWKGSQLGDTLNALRALDAGGRPVDKEVFMRELDYFEIMAGSEEPQVPGSD